MIKEYRNRDPHGIKTLFEELIETSESIFSIRLPDETFRGVINFLRAIIPGTPTDEIEQALVSEFIKNPEFLLVLAVFHKKFSLLRLHKSVFRCNSEFGIFLKFTK